MKKLLIGSLVVMALLFSPLITRADTVSDLQAQIAKLTAQIAAMQAQKGGGSTDGGTIINPGGRSTGFVKFVEGPTLKTTLNRDRSESSLEASAVIEIQAGSRDLLTTNTISLAVLNQNGQQAYMTQMTTLPVGVSGAANENIETKMGGLNVWRIKANTKARFKIISIGNPQKMFAGSYRASLQDIGILNADLSNFEYGVLAYDGTKSAPVIVVGEKSPYITAVTFAPVKGYNAIKIDGQRLNSSQKAIVKCNPNSVELDAQYYSGTTDGKSTTYSFAKDGPIGQSCYVQVSDSKTGNSNIVWFLYGQKDPPPTVSVNIVDGTSYGNSGDAFIRLSIKGNDTNKIIHHWVLGYMCQIGLIIDTGNSLLCDGKSSDKSALSFYARDMYDVTQDYLMLTAGAKNSNQYAVQSPFSLEARNSDDKTIGRDDKIITVSSLNAPTASGQETNRATLTLSYDSSSKESSLTAKQNFSVTAGSADVYIFNPSFNISRIAGDSVTPKSGWIPNGATYGLAGINNTELRNFTDLYGGNQNGWLVRAGQTATFEAGVGMNPQLMFPGIYTAELISPQSYSQNNYSNLVWGTASLPSAGVTIVGENTNPLPVPVETGSLSCTGRLPYIFTRNLTVGSSGDDVIALQCFLASKGYAMTGYISGYFGAQTKASLASYEAAKGISPAEGYFGPIARAAVNAESVSGTTSTTTISTPPTTADQTGNVTLCFRGKTIQVSEYLRARYVSAGAIVNACPTSYDQTKLDSIATAIQALQAALASFVKGR